MTDQHSGVYARIGSLASRLSNRVGRAFGSCHRCGRPTRSHATASGVECHRCHVEHGGLVADGGRRVGDSGEASGQHDDGSRRHDAAGLKDLAAALGTGADDLDPRDDRRAAIAGYAANGVETCRCGRDPDSAPEAFVEQAVDACATWLGRRDPLDRDAFDDLRARFAREPGQPAVPAANDADSGPRNVHVREVDGAELGRWVADADTALLDLDDQVGFADLHGVPVGDGDDDEIVPLVVAADGLFAEVAADFHDHYHALPRVRDALDGDGRVLTDGGAGDRLDSDDAETDRQRDAATIDRSTAETLLDDAGEPATWGEVRRAVVEADALDPDDPGAAVDDALDRGVLVERDDGGNFPTLALGDQDSDDEPGDDGSGEQIPAGREAFVDAIRFFADQLDRTIHPDEDTTAREHYREGRGWSDETIREKRLGYAPPSETALLDHLMREGYDREAILATGLFWDDLSPIWKGRLVLPYLDADGRPVFAISRSLDHPADDAGVYAEGDDPAKYHKIPNPDERAVREPIYGLSSVEPGEPVVVTEGIADAITAHQAGHPCLSPVTTTFKKSDRERLVDALREADVPRVYVVQDAERPGSDLSDEGDLSLPAFGEGVRGAVSTARFVADAGIEAYIGELPRPGLDKVDLDDYLLRWGDLDPVLASAKPAREHPAYDPDERTDQRADTDRSRSAVEADVDSTDREASAGRSRLFDLDLTDVAPVDAGDRTTNPLGHHGESENYYVVADDGATAYDHKYKTTYTAATHLLVDAGERTPGDPEGELDDAEVFTAWRRAKAANALHSGDPVPYRALRGVAVADGLVERDDLVERDSDSGEVVDDDQAGGTYTALPSGTYNDALDHVRETYDVDPGREPVDTGGRDDHGDDSASSDPLDAAVVLDPGRAWRAAGAVDPDDLDADADDELPTVETDDGRAFATPDGVRAPDVVRAVALDRGLVETVDADLGADYARAYRLAREDYGAPLPRYVTAAEAVADYDTVLGAVRELDFWHLDRDALVAEVTGEGDDVDGEAVLTLDPSPVDGWRDSDSGASVLVFPSGTVYDADAGDDSDDDRGTAIDALRFVALDSGILDDPTDAWGDGEFCEAYRIAREVYGAPLPRWYAAEARDRDADRVPFVPDPDDLLGDDAAALDSDDDGLDDVYDQVGELVREATDPDDTDRVTVVGAVPATGKTTAVIKQAREQPTTYLAPRLDLQAQAVEKAERWGVSYDVLPVFSDGSVDDDAVEQAVAYVREHGKDALRERWRLVDAAGGGAGDVFVDDDADDLEGDDTDTDEVDLDRATCPTMTGEHGAAWALAVATARALDYEPREIHRDAVGLFGAPIPCACDDHDHDGGEAAEPDDGDGEAGTCPYSAAWDDINDRDDPADLLIGSYGHAYVEGARTYRAGSRDDPDDPPRAVALDEQPRDAFASDYGPEAFGFAAWLASALVDDVEARADVTPALADDDRLVAWLDGTIADDFPGVQAAKTALRDRRAALEAVEAAREVRDRYDDLPDLDLDDPLADLVATWDDADGAPDAATLRDAAGDLVDPVGAIRPTDDAAPVAGWVRDDVLDPLLDLDGDADLELDADTLPVPADGALANVVEHALDASAARADGAVTALRAAERALAGGADGCRELAIWSDDGYAHPDAARLLRGVITPRDADASSRIHTGGYDYPAPDDAGDGSVLKQVRLGERTTVLVDENEQGATILDPPERHAAGGDTCPLVGLDATPRPELWAFALGARGDPDAVDVVDVHDGWRERAAFLRDHHDVTVAQMSARARPYSGDPDGKDTDGDVALVEHLADEYAGTYGPRRRDEQATDLGDPAVVTSKSVEQVLDDDDRLAGKVSTFEHYGDLDGRNDLGEHRLAALLGSPHYGDHYVERIAALCGEEVDTSRATGRGMNLDYGSDVANAALRGMREDRVAQAILRFARGDSGATVFARTAALRDDLPVRAEGRIAKTYTANDTAIAEAAAALDRERERFTTADVRERLGADAPSPREVRRTLRELATAGYVERDSDGVGTAYEYDQVTSPGAGEVETPEVDAETVVDHPDKRRKGTYYTASVRVVPPDRLLDDRGGGGPGADTRLPAPGTAPERAAGGVGPPG